MSACKLTGLNLPLILSLLGGMLIGGAALLLMLANGRVMGVSSILGGLLGSAEPKLAFGIYRWGYFSSIYCFNLVCMIFLSSG